MVPILHVSAVLLAALAMAPAVAHALELPGKMRLSRDAYATVQTIYYPGFTAAGVAEPAAALATLSLLAVTPLASADFWLVLVALLGLVGMQAVFWLVTQPVNRLWVRDVELGPLGERFFAPSRAPAGDGDWQRLRDRWERSHAVRAALAATSLTALVVALA